MATRNFTAERRAALSLLQIDALTRAAESAGIPPAAVSEMIGHAQRELFAALKPVQWPDALFDMATDSVEVHGRDATPDGETGERFWLFGEQELQEFAHNLVSLPPVEPAAVWALVPFDDWREYAARTTARQ